jgi:hypothetical protein
LRVVRNLKECGISFLVRGRVLGWCSICVLVLSGWEIYPLVLI